MFPEAWLARGSQLKRQSLGGGDWFLVLKSIMNATFRMISVSATLLLTACPQNSAVWIQPGSTQDHVAFVVSGAPRGSRKPIPYAGVFRVDRCGSRPDYSSEPVWGIYPTLEATDTGLHEIVYGELPPGYEAMVNRAGLPGPLTPGCYLVTMSGTGRMSFDVLPNGTVVERPAEP